MRSLRYDKFPKRIPFTHSRYCQFIWTSLKYVRHVFTRNYCRSKARNDIRERDFNVRRFSFRWILLLLEFDFSGQKSYLTVVSRNRCESFAMHRGKTFRDDLFARLRLCFSDYVFRFNWIGRPRSLIFDLWSRSSERASRSPSLRVVSRDSCRYSETVIDYFSCVCARVCTCM